LKNNNKGIQNSSKERKNIRDSELQRGKVAILTEQSLPLTVIDDFIVRALGKKGVLGKNINRNKIQFIAENSNSSSQSIVYGLRSSISSPSSSCPSLSLSSRLSRPLIENGPNEGRYPDSLELNELNEPLNSSTHELTNSSTPDFSPDPIYQTTYSLPVNEVVYYFHHDHLGNIRAVTDSNGNVVERHDFYPFGEEISQPTNKDSYLFTGKPRDSETGLDYFGARYYSSFFSRFLSVDPGKSNPRIPQTWNKYTYCLNNPIKYIDPTGRYFIIPSNDKNRNQILRALALGALTPSGSKVFWQIQRDPRPVTLKSGKFPPKHEFDPKTKQLETKIILGQRTGYKRDGSNLSGLEFSFDWKIIREESKKGNVDPQGIRTMYHELFHVGAGLEGKDFVTAIANMAAGDKPSSEEGPARRFGEQVFAEYQYLLEFLGNSGATQIMDYLIKSTIEEIEQKQQQMIIETVLNVTREFLSIF
jgi:RHS repeat-associated protein